MKKVVYYDTNRPYTHPRRVRLYSAGDVATWAAGCFLIGFVAALILCRLPV